ncbi:MAG: protein kinase [Myxococcota bacterium]|nr:protein kinase [Myxococcota bacterium]
MDWTGQTIADRYVVEQKLDAGGMGTVYIARDTGVRGRQVVVKVPHPKLLTPEFRRRFEIEIDQLVALEHPHVVHVYGAGTHEDVPYLAVQYLAGGDLNARLRKGTLTPNEVRPWLRAIASALDHAHRNGCIHRDVKPGNIIFDAEGHAYLSDFGIATVVSSAESSSEGLTQAGTFLGSIPYLPPEAMAREFAAPYDQYSLALVVYHALSGKMAFEGETTRAILEAKVAGEAVSLDLRVAGLPPALVEAVMRAIEVDPRRRFESCTAFADAFDASLQGWDGADGVRPVPDAATAPAAAPATRDEPASTPAPSAQTITGPIAKGGPLAALADNAQYLALGGAILGLAALLLWLVLTSPDEPVEPALDPGLPVAQVDEGATPAPVEETPPAPIETPSEALPEPTPEPVAVQPATFFAQRDITLFASEGLDGTVLGVIAAGTELLGVDGGDWVSLADPVLGEGYVRSTGLGSAAPALGEAPTRRVALVPADGEAAEFRIDTREVPVRAYRSCVAAGGCSPARSGPGCHGESGPADARANCLTASQADAFCAWAGKRLPSESEWLRGAAVSGVGGFSGGVAEWTSSPTEAGSVVRESPESRFVLPDDAALPGVGFRCAAG